MVDPDGRVMHNLETCGRRIVDGKKYIIIEKVKRKTPLLKWGTSLFTQLALKYRDVNQIYENKEYTIPS